MAQAITREQFMEAAKASIAVARAIVSVVRVSEKEGRPTHESELAKFMGLAGITPEQNHNLVQMLIEAGQVERTSQGYLMPGTKPIDGGIFEPEAV